MMRRYTSPPRYDSRSSETDPLVAGEASRRHSCSLNQCLWITFVVTFAMAITLVLYTSTFPLGPCNNPLDPDVQDRIRKEWDIERRQHQEEALRRIYIEQRWRVEDDERVHLRVQWMREIEEHERNLSEAIRRENQEKLARRVQWEKEVEEHSQKEKKRLAQFEKNMEETRALWKREVAQRSVEWAREVEEHTHEEKERQARFEMNMEEAQARWRREVAQRSAEWEREVGEHDRDIKERTRREEEERLRLNMFWTDPESHTCTTYGTREYTARLVNVPGDYNRRVEACMATPIQVHGVEYKTKWCEDYGPSNVIGHWDVDQHEPDCASYWNWYKDLGCVSPGSGQRRIEHYLENLPHGADWREFCATTPASFHGMHWFGAEFCFQQDFGTYGHWVFNDESCN